MSQPIFVERAPDIWPPWLGYGIESDRSNAPTYCPLCGRRLEWTSWTTVDGDRRYDALVCFAGSRWAWFHRLVKATYPGGTHYRYELGDVPTFQEPLRFDRHTGKPLS